MVRSLLDQDRAPLIDWALVGGGLIGAWAWLAVAQMLGATIQMESQFGATALYMLMVFIPLAAIALLLGFFADIKVLRAGRRAGFWAVSGLAAGFLLLLSTLAYSWLNGGVVSGDAAGIGFAMLLLALAITMVQVGAEELLFRGWLQPQVERVTNGWVAVFASAALFSLFHLAGGERAAISLLGLFLAGLLLAMLARRTGGLVAPFALHLAWNFSESTIFGLTPNPGVGPFGAFFDLDVMGSPLWGGNEEGLNNSIGTPIVLLAICLALAIRRSSTRPEAAPQ